MATASYWLWFYWAGLDALPSSGCLENYTFFFARVDLYGWCRTVCKVFTIVYLVLSPVFGTE
jgi:hypothetical protein